MARRKRKSDEAPGWVWMLFGLGIGLIIALGVYLNTQPTPNSAAQVPIAAQPTQDPVVEQPLVEPEPAPAAVTAQPERNDDAGEPALEQEQGEDPNRFGFYEQLPNFEVVIPEVETPTAQTEEVVAIADPGIYVLQAGSFLTESDAEAQRARLALLGVESRIQRVSIDDRRFHRVRIGPIENLDHLNSVRTLLAGANVDSLVMRLNQ